MAKEASPYRVLVRELPTHRQFEVPAERVGAWLKGHPMRDALGAPDPDPRAGDGLADLELYAEATHAFATGTFKGHVIVANEDVTAFSEAEFNRIRRKVTMVFQSGALFDSLTVAENISFSLELRQDYDAQNKDDVVAGLLHLVGLWESREAYPGDLSTGYRRAIAIARALAAQPQCILYDEPTTMVDPIMSAHLTKLMLRLKTQLRLTGVVVTHDLDLMFNVADRVVVLFEGRAIYFGPVSELDKSPHPHIQEFLAMDRV